MAERAVLQGRVGRADCLEGEMEVTQALSANIQKEFNVR
jgi:hypothetical protein